MLQKTMNVNAQDEKYMSHPNWKENTMGSQRVQFRPKRIVIGKCFTQYEMLSEIVPSSKWSCGRHSRRVVT